ncbi:Acetyltransferase (GNAT) family protein [Anatilimnocola aggregata]|uniref:Acetyltransferase (GNAT) family protein n=1 Tax=Anatilimnocola aggregata TaxID=2528021 RepID=A0A517YML7_9BACT|nr:GNAT family N-acetyltransferase [Anatilimnocola aggregata]QDU31467.1 Acetyltransferase (GNAT) family protein [Anatilimnocola aggregata]
MADNLLDKLSEHFKERSVVIHRESHVGTPWESLALLLDEIPGGDGAYTSLLSVKRISSVADSLLISMLAVNESHRKRGLGKQLLREVCDWADKERVILCAVAQLCSLDFNFTPLAYKKLTRNQTIGEPLANFHKNWVWNSHLVSRYGFTRVGNDGEIVREPKPHG